MSDVIRAAKAPKPVGAYPHARRVGNLLFLSGIGPRDAATNAIPGNVHDVDGNLVSYDIEAQCRSVFANVRTVLEASGARWQDLVDVTVFLTDMERDFAAYNRSTQNISPMRSRAARRSASPRCRRRSRSN